MTEHVDPNCVPKEQYDALVAEALSVQTENDQWKNKYGLLRQDKERAERLQEAALERVRVLEHFITEQAMRQYWRKHR
jgi:hypothetical protein